MLGYQYQVCTSNGYWFMDIFLPIVIMGKLNLDHKIQK